MNILIYIFVILSIILLNKFKFKLLKNKFLKIIIPNLLVLAFCFYEYKNLKNAIIETLLIMIVVNSGYIFKFCKRKL